jgi:DNA-directed RNA polymerase specialized sigma24 family protein
VNRSRLLMLRRERKDARGAGNVDPFTFPLPASPSTLCVGMASDTKPPPAHALSERLTPEVFRTGRKKALLYAKYATHSRSEAEALVDEALAAMIDPRDSLWDPSAQPDFGGHLLTIIRNKLPAERRTERRRSDEAWQGAPADATTSRAPTPETLEERIDAAEQQVETGRVLDEATTLLRVAGHERPARVIELWRDAVDQPVDQARTLGSTVAEIYRDREVARRYVEKANQHET